MIQTCPQQANGYDCGVHVIITCMHESAGFPLGSYFDVSTWRLVLLSALKGAPLSLPLDLEWGVPGSMDAWALLQMHRMQLREWESADADQVLRILRWYEDTWMSRVRELSKEKSDLLRRADFYRRSREVLRSRRGENKAPSVLVGDIDAEVLTIDLGIPKLEARERLFETRLAKLSAAMQTAQAIRGGMEARRSSLRQKVLKAIGDQRLQCLRRIADEESRVKELDSLLQDLA